MVLVIGEILFDIFPEVQRLGGAPFNFAYHIKKLGLPVRFISRVADDANGRIILDFLKQNEFDLDDIQIDSNLKTGIVNVKMRADKSHDFEIVKNVSYDNLQFNKKIEKLLKSAPDLIYFGTLLQRSANGFNFIEKVFKNKEAGTDLFCDLNLRQGCYDDRIILRSLEYSNMLKINEEELHKLLNLESVNDSTYEIDQLLNKYNIKNMIITKGKDGSSWYAGNKNINRKIRKNINIVDTVGAGDAFAAVAAAGYLQKIPIKKILELSTEFASYICTIQGALPADDRYYNYIKRKMEKYCEK